MKILAEKLIKLDMEVLGNLLKLGKLPPLSLVKHNRDSIAESIKDTDVNYYEKKCLLEDLDVVIFNVEQSNGCQEIWDVIIDECDDKYQHLRLVK